MGHGPLCVCSRKEVVKEEGTLPSKAGISPQKLPDQTPRMARTRQTLKGASKLTNSCRVPTGLRLGWAPS